MPAHNDTVFNKPLMLGAIPQLQKETSFAALKTCPVVMADSIEGTYKYWNLEDLLRFEVAERKPGSYYKRVDTDLDTRTYYCKDYGLEEPLPIESVGELGGNPLQNIADKLFINGMMNFEQEFVTTAFDVAGNGFTKVYDVSSGAELLGKQWDATDSNPIEDIEQGLDYVEDQTGLRPNTITCGRDVYRKLKQNPEIIDRLATNELRILRSEEALARIFDVSEFNVTKGTYITGNEKTTETKSAFVTKKLIASYKAPTNPGVSPNGLLIIVRNYAGDIVGANGMGIETYFEKASDSTIIRLKQRFDIVVPSPALGVAFNNCIA